MIIIQTTNLKIKYEDYKAFFPDRAWTKQQIKFHEETFNRLITDRDTLKVTAIPAPCGVGKTTFITTLILACLCDENYNFRNEPVGMVVVTDNLDRLSGIRNGSNESNGYLDGFIKRWIHNYVIQTEKIKRFEKLIYLMDSEKDLMTQLLEQQNYPIVLLTTQRYFMLNESNREMLFKYRFWNEEHSRNTVIFDEKPFFSKLNVLNDKVLSSISLAINNGLDNKISMKKSIKRAFRLLEDFFLDEMDEKEDLREDENTALSWHCNDEKIIETYDFLCQCLKGYMSRLIHIYPSFEKDFENIGRVLKEGAIFNSTKNNQGMYSKEFLTITDNRNSFYLGGDRKFFVFDATADIDPEYDVDYVEVLDCNEYKNKVEKFEIIHVEANTSKNSIAVTKKSGTDVVKSICEHIQNVHRHSIQASDPLVITYKYIEKNMPFAYKCHFGNVKGTNDYRNLNRMAQVGINRFPNIKYFFIKCGCDISIYNSVLKMKEEESIEFFENVVKKTGFIEDVMLKSILTDFEQNLYRIAIRNYGYKKTIKAYWYYSTRSEIYRKILPALKNRFECIGAQITEQGIPMKMAAQKTIKRKAPGDAENTHAQLIISWINRQSLRREFKIKQLLEGTGLTAQQLQSAKQKNSVLKAWFKNAESDRRGYYIVKQHIGAA